MPDAQARIRSDGTLLGFRQRVRSCRRWQLIICDFGFTRFVAISACTSGFVTGVESKTPPMVPYLPFYMGLGPAISRCRHYSTALDFHCLFHKCRELVCPVDGRKHGVGQGNDFLAVRFKEEAGLDGGIRGLGEPGHIVVLTPRVEARQFFR